ncbi:MAG: ABC transporter ATP-binding protein [Desulfurococcaceae archaeon]
MIRALILRAGYGRGRCVLWNTDLKVDTGEAVLITGGVGSGKTTLLLAITGVLNNLLEGFVEGSVEINGFNPIEPSGFSKIPLEVGFVLQDPDKQIAMPTPIDELYFTLENLGYSYSDAFKLAMDGLKKIGLVSKAFQHVETLSHGEKRKLTFIASVIHNPRVLVLDEPTASMDPYGIATTREFIRESRREGLSIIIVEHKKDYFIDLVDRVFVMREGRLYETGINGDFGKNALYEKFQRILDSKPRDEHKFGDVVLKMENVSIGYNETLVSGIDMVVREGMTIGVVGRNGCGKTTLLKTIAGFIKPIDGVINRFTKTFYVPQQPDYIFLSNSVSGELDLLRRKTGFKLEDSIIRIESLKKDFAKSPYKLSHGQRRLLSLVIALAYKPKIILLDEPTTGLDDESVNQLIESIVTLKNKGFSFIIATHDPRISPVIDEYIFIDDGKVRSVSHTDVFRWFIDVSMG